MISNAKRATTNVKMQTVMRPLSELAVSSLILSSLPATLSRPDHPTWLSRTDSKVRLLDRAQTVQTGPENHQTWSE